MITRIATAAVAAALLSSIAAPALASDSYPVVFAFKKGAMRGQNWEAAPGVGRIKASNGKVTCSGRYDWHDESPDITVPLRCTDGRTGYTSASRGLAPDEVGPYAAGGGKVTLSDGSTGAFYWGDDAR